MKGNKSKTDMKGINLELRGGNKSKADMKRN